MSKRRRRVALATDSGAIVYAHITDDTKPETIAALKALGDAVARLTPAQIEAMREKPNEHEFCRQDWHRCWDGGGPGEHARYER